MKTAHTKSAEIALILDSSQQLVETLSDDREIHLFDAEWKLGDPNPLEKIHVARSVQAREDNEFGDYVEELLSQPFLRKEIQDHGLNWLKSKLRIEQYQKTERDAAQVISEFAYKIFSENPAKTDFVLAGPQSQVRVRVYVVNESFAGKRAA